VTYMFNQQLADKIADYLNSVFPSKIQLDDLKAALPEFRTLSEEVWLTALDGLEREQRVEFKGIRTGFNNALGAVANIAIVTAERKRLSQTARGNSIGPSPISPVVFVSCGQSTSAERELGKAIAELVETGTGCAAYFAENQNSLQGVTENILKRLNDAVAFIAVMHPRGDVSHGKHRNEPGWVRGSVWVEQEIAIAAFISQALDRPIPVRSYVHESIRREGLRDKLHMNPVLFHDDPEILNDLTSFLPSWRHLGQNPGKAQHSDPISPTAHYLADLMSELEDNLHKARAPRVGDVYSRPSSRVWKEYRNRLNIPPDLHNRIGNAYVQIDEWQDIVASGLNPNMGSMTLNLKVTDLSRDLPNLISELKKIDVLSKLPKLSSDAQQLLLKASEDNAGPIMVVEMNEGLIVQIDKTQFAETGNRKSEARWRQAIDELLRLELARRPQPDSDILDITHAGYEYAEKLRSAGVGSSN
jgi:hypothetical protein